MVTGGSERDRRFAFLWPPLLGAVAAAVLPLPALNRQGLGEDLLPAVALAAMTGASLGLLYAGRRAPGGGGWGRVAALWLGFALLLPGAAAWGLRHDPPQTGHVLLAALWVILSALPFGRWETLDARQCLGFSARFYGLWLVVMLAVTPLSPNVGGTALALAYFASPLLASVIRRRLTAPHHG